MEAVLQAYGELRKLFPAENLCAKLCQTIHQTVQEVIDSIPDNARIAIRAGGFHTQYLLDEFDLSHKSIVGIIDRQNDFQTILGYPRYDVEEVPALECDYIILSTFFLRKEMREELASYTGRVIDFYDELDRRGVPLQAPFHNYVENSHMLLNFYYLKYISSKNSPAFDRSLRELLQAAVENKDFVILSRLYEENGGANGGHPLLKAVWDKTERLLGVIRGQLEKRRQKDIILYWVDAVSYKNFLANFPKLRKASEEGCSFPKAYTNTPYTHSTMRAIFRKILPIDDFEKTGEQVCGSNSPLIQYLEEKGYQVKIISDSVLSEKYLIRMEEFATCNIKWWDMLIGLLGSEKPCFYLIHFLSESHPPFIFPALRSMEYNISVESTQTQSQIQQSYGYLDDCLDLYRELAGSKIQVFFSDHGENMISDLHWAEVRLHAFCFIQGKGIQKQAVPRFFQHRNFVRLVQWLVEPEQFSLEDACSDEAVFQDTDMYSLLHISKFIRYGVPKKGLAYRGIRNDRYKYVLNSIGEEFFYTYDADGREEQAVLEDGELRSELQEKCGTQFLDVYALDKFKYSRRLYEVIRAGET